MRKTCGSGLGFVIGLLLLGAAPAWAQPPAPASTTPARNARPAQPAAQATPAPVTAAPPAIVQDGDMPAPDAERVRENMRQVLDRVPPSVRQVLQLEPSLLGSAEYLAPYPELAAFIARHPEVIRNPAFYVGTPHDNDWSRDPARVAVSMWTDVMQGLFILTLFLIVTGIFTWLIRTFIDYRRWLRLSKVQNDTHTKLLDRLTNNEDLIAYMQTTAGRRFLELAPISLDAASRPLGAPLNRILWSVQAGVVLALGGIGMVIISHRTVPEVSGPVMAVGILAIAIGAGFAVSAVVAWVLSKRLGLLDPKASPDNVPAESGVTR